MKYFYLIFILVLCLTSCKQANTSITENEILWDTYGVPHIYATSDNDLYFMSAWGQMKNHGNLGSFKMQNNVLRALNKITTKELGQPLREFENNGQLLMNCY